MKAPSDSVFVNTMKATRKPSTRKSPCLKFLKPGALAKLRDSRIIAKSHRNIDPFLQISAPLSPPSFSNQQPLIDTMDGLPFFPPRIYGPKCPQRKKLTAVKSVLFLNSGSQDTNNVAAH